MKRLALIFTALLMLTSSGRVSAQNSKPDSSAQKPATATQTLNDAEQKFKEMLTNVTLDGRWCLVEKGKLGPEKQDKYSIVSVAKVKGDSWIVNARMKYGEREIVAPIPVEVKWAGDTAVLVVDKMTVPGGGTYSARVLFYEKTYAGSWTGGEHAGLLNGTISRNKE